jgi:hypothetical protein
MTSEERERRKAIKEDAHWRVRRALAATEKLTGDRREGFAKA